MKKVPYMDIATLPEEQRIELIGDMATCSPGPVGFVVEDEPGKAERYVAGILKKHPNLHHLDTRPGPVARTVLVRIGRAMPGGN